MSSQIPHTSIYCPVGGPALSERSSPSPPYQTVVSHTFFGSPFQTFPHCALISWFWATDSSYLCTGTRQNFIRAFFTGPPGVSSFLTSPDRNSHVFEFLCTQRKGGGKRMDGINEAKLQGSSSCKNLEFVRGFTHAVLKILLQHLNCPM
jgi:hypothetical protein